MSRKLLCFLSLLLFCHAALSEEYTGPAVAVVPFTGSLPDGNSVVIPGIADIFMVELIDPIHQCDGVVVEWARRKAVLQELELQHSKYGDPSTAAPLGQLVQPDFFINGVINGDDTTLTWELTITSAEDGQVVATDKGSTPIENIFDFTTDVAKRLAEKLCKEQAGYSMYGTMDDATIRGTICGSLAKPFTAVSPEVGGSWQFTPTSDSAGSFSYTAQNVGGVPGSGSGTYRVVRSKSGSVRIQLAGTGSIHSPLGTFSAKITEPLDLTPIKTCGKRGFK